MFIYIFLIIPPPPLIKLKETLKIVNNYDSFNLDHFCFVNTFDLKYMLE